MSCRRARGLESNDVDDPADLGTAAAELAGCHVEMIADPGPPLVRLDASRRHRPAPALAWWCLGAGILATVGANLAHGLGHGPIGALVSAWPALALVGSFELLMILVRAERGGTVEQPPLASPGQAAPQAGKDAPPALAGRPPLEQTVHAWHHAGRSQRAIARELHIDRRKVKRILDRAA